VFQDAEGKPISQEALLPRMREHTTVVGRYKAVYADVVNEALNEDGTLQQSSGSTSLEKTTARAFEYARGGPECRVITITTSITKPSAGAVELGRN
jgi:GH35 family endo-1,4-beta-xylanase